MNYVVLQGNAPKNHPLLRGVESPQFVAFDALPSLVIELTINDTLIVVNELTATEHRQRGRPKNVGNGASALDNRINEVVTLLESGMKRGKIAHTLGVGRDTLNDFIAAKLPQYHRKKIG